jgi:hypothetical protein
MSQDHYDMSYTSFRHSLVWYCTIALNGTVPGRCADHQQATTMSGEQMPRLRHSQGSRGSYSGKKKAWLTHLQTVRDFIYNAVV